MAFSSSTFSTIPAFLYKSTRHAPDNKTRLRPPITATLAEKKNTNALQYRKLGDSDLEISEITMGTMTFGEQNTEKEAHEMLSYAFDHGINIFDTSEADFPGSLSLFPLIREVDLTV